MVWSMVRSEDQTSPSDMSMVEVDMMKGLEAYKPWMLVEKKSKRKPRELQRSGVNNSKGKDMGSRFTTLFSLDKEEEDNYSGIEKIIGSYNKGKKVMDRVVSRCPTKIGRSDLGPYQEKIGKFL
ncbi:hypothetical protein GOBAR_AA19992 [Gossypium barbadense]|uniref:Uncharacterized protein n=1 Tax=Gossypium barbadense TaxID=3634 RepID=A0A2P5XBG9_GOSBA|nr:hypothetical protein GOBAR_AA19992 [Gossypium barbadense]